MNRLSRTIENMARVVTRGLSTFARNTRASVAVEAALLFPLLVLTLNGAYELSRYTLAVNQLDRASQTLCMLLARAPSAAAADVIGQIPYAAAANVAQPFNVYLDGKVIVSLVVNATNNGRGPVVLWQDSYGTATKTSRVGGAGNSATVPAGLVPQGSMTFVVEVFYDYRASVYRRFFGDIVDQVGEIYRITYYMPRFAPFVS
jgi:Flp pilus assembly protein TadG